MSRWTFSTEPEQDEFLGTIYPAIENDRLEGPVQLVAVKTDAGLLLAAVDPDDDEEFPPLGPFENEEALLIAWRLL